MKASKLLLRTPITVKLAHELILDIQELYHFIYTYELGYDEYIDKGDELLKSMAHDKKLKSLITAMVELRGGDIFSSDREVACLYLVLREEELIEED